MHDGEPCRWRCWWNDGGVGGCWVENGEVEIKIRCVFCHEIMHGSSFGDPLLDSQTVAVDGCWSETEISNENLMSILS